MFSWYPRPPLDYPYYWVILDPKSKEDKVKVTNLKNSPKFQFFQFRNKHHTQHTLSSSLIRCANMKWMQQVLFKIQSGHDSVHRWRDGQGETSIHPFQLRWSGGFNFITGNIDHLTMLQVMAYSCQTTLNHRTPCIKYFFTCPTFKTFHL